MKIQLTDELKVQGGTVLLAGAAGVASTAYIVGQAGGSPSRRSIVVHVEGPYHVSMKQAGLMKGKSKKQLREEGLL